VTVRQRRCIVFIVMCAACALAPTAGAAGPPLPSYASGKAGAVAPGGKERLVTRRAGDDTAVIAVSRGDGRVLRSGVIRGHWRVSPATLDGGTTGLSADGGTLVLARPDRSFPPASTRLAVVDAKGLVVRRQVVLNGFFTVDAISPDGRWVYVIQYSGENFLDYRVRALDTRTGRLASRDVVDPRSPGEQMGGLPLTRVMSRDGRWAYTLYGGGEEVFIHALDTVGRTAACIDLEMLPPDSDLSGFQLILSADGRQIRVLSTRTLVATVDARTFAASEPGEAPASVSDRPVEQQPRPAAATDKSGFPWPAFAAVAILAGLCAGAVAIARRRAWALGRGRGQPR
jgi:hypothetical protein